MEAPRNIAYLIWRLQEGLLLKLQCIIAELEPLRVIGKG
jgi:hypothetical protein